MIAETSEAGLELHYEGPGQATEIWGVIQANFLLTYPDRNAREVAVNIGLPVVPYMAEKAGREDEPGFGIRVARAIGECRLRQLHAAGMPIDAVEVISVDFLERQPELVACALAPLTAGV
jgi:hypothetical protein